MLELSGKWKQTLHLNSSPRQTMHGHEGMATVCSLSPRPSHLVNSLPAVFRQQYLERVRLSRIVGCLTRQLGTTQRVVFVQVLQRHFKVCRNKKGVKSLQVTTSTEKQAPQPTAHIPQPTERKTNLVFRPAGQTTHTPLMASLTKLNDVCKTAHRHTARLCGSL